MNKKVAWFVPYLKKTKMAHILGMVGRRYQKSINCFEKLFSKSFLAFLSEVSSPRKMSSASAPISVDLIELIDEKVIENGNKIALNLISRRR